MKRSNAPFSLIIMIVAGFFSITAGAQQEKIVKRLTPVGASALDGKGLYVQFCAPCHGRDAKGNGPAAKSLKTAPSDLTQIARKNGGKYPDTRMLAILKGDEPV